MIVPIVLVVLAVLAALARLLLPLVPLPATGAVASAARAITWLTEPPIAAIRAVVRPVRVGSTAVDLAPVLLLIGLCLLSSLLFR